MKHTYAAVVVILVMLAMLSCNKPGANLIDGHAVSPTAVVFSTSLADSLPQSTYEALGIGHVTGVKIVNLHGLDARYFEYQADVETLLKALSDSPFHIQTKIADTKCRAVSYRDLVRELSPANEAEVVYSNEMLTKRGAEFEFYVCVKSPVKHFVVLNRSTGRVWHRIVREA